MVVVVVFFLVLYRYIQLLFYFKLCITYIFLLTLLKNILKPQLLYVWKGTYSTRKPLAPMFYSSKHNLLFLGTVKK